MLLVILAGDIPSRHRSSISLRVKHKRKRYEKRSTTRAVVITGTSAGIGRATVRAFARRGASLGLLARGQEGLQGARREVAKLGGQAVVVPTDVVDPGQVERAAVTVEKAFGPIDVWINNAMVSVLVASFR